MRHPGCRTGERRPRALNHRQRRDAWLKSPQPDAEFDETTIAQRAAVTLAHGDRGTAALVQCDAADQKHAPRTVVVGRPFNLRHEALEAAVDDGIPGAQPIIGEPAYREDESSALYDALQGIPALAEWSRPEIAPVDVRDVERHRERRCRQLVARMADQTAEARRCSRCSGTMCCRRAPSRRSCAVRRSSTGQNPMRMRTGASDSPQRRSESLIRSDD